MDIVRLADFVQTEGAISFVHAGRRWYPVIGVAMSVEEPMGYTSGLLEIALYHRNHHKVDAESWSWAIQHYHY